MPLAILLGSGPVVSTLVFGRWEIQDDKIILKFTETQQEVSHTPIGTSNDFQEFYDIDRELHFFCVGTEFAVVAEKDDREELDAFVQLYKRVRNILV